MQPKRLGWAAVAVAVFLGGWAAGASAQTAGRDGRSDRANQPAAEKGLKPGTVRASKIIGMNVYDRQGNDKLGTVKDVLIDPSANRVEYAVLSTTKAAGMGDRYVGVPWTEFTETQDGKDLAIKTDKDRLAQAPSFTGDRWPDQADRSFWDKVSSYFGGSASNASSEAAREMHLVRGSQLLKQAVENPQSQRLGTIQDLVYDVSSGRVRYAVLGEGGVLGLGEKYVAIPLNAFRFSDDNSKLVLNADKDRLAQAPGFDKNNWPDVANRQFDQQVTNYWGSRG